MSDRTPPEDEDEHDETGQPDPWQDLDADSEQTDPWATVDETDEDVDHADDTDYAADTDHNTQRDPTAVGHRDEPAAEGEPAVETPAPAAEEAFDEMGVDELDGEALWDELAGGETPAETFDPDAVAGTSVDADPAETVAAGRAEVEAGGAEPVDAGGTDTTVGQATTGQPDGSHTAGDSNEAVVDKRKYCQQCPYFSEPPAVGCSHEGTSIVEVLLDGQFRLRNCPVVTESGPDRTILNDGP